MINSPYCKFLEFLDYTLELFYACTNQEPEIYDNPDMILLHEGHKQELLVEFLNEQLTDISLIKKEIIDSQSNIENEITDLDTQIAKVLSS